MATKKNKYPALTIKQLAKLCAEEIKAGNGDKKILISSDDEGNGFHGLFYPFTTAQEEIDILYEHNYFHDPVDPKTVVILG